MFRGPHAEVLIRFKVIDGLIKNMRAPESLAGSAVGQKHAVFELPVFCLQLNSIDII
jgi:hypothetical protein